MTEEDRLKGAADRTENWQRWGTYLPERQWGTVREDYSADGNPWSAFPFDMATYRAYRWGEDGLLGWTDRECRLTFSTSLWNGKDDRLKERLFGLSNPEGNHGEDVKEQYYYLDSTPTGSYAKALYKYPQAAFPYEDLRQKNHEAGYDKHEYELIDTGIFAEERYFDVQIEYAKRDVEDMLIRVTISNRGPDPASLTVLPTLTLRNNWSWRNLEPGAETKPVIRLQEASAAAVVASHKTLGDFRFQPIPRGEQPTPEVLFTENDTNIHRLDSNYNGEEGCTKDAFERYIVHGETGVCSTQSEGTKFALVYREEIPAGESRELCFRLVLQQGCDPAPLSIDDFDATFRDRISDANDFYAARIPEDLSDDEKNVARQAYAGLLWSRQFYYYISERWLDGDPAQPPPPDGRAAGRNSNWRHLFCRDILSVPDKWEYPWFAAWDTAFHMIPMADLDPEFAKAQLSLLLREWYMHPNGQLPAYEFDFSDVNPPVHAWAVLHVYDIDARRTGKPDTDFLERCFQKLLLNFNWWVNHFDESAENIFGGGFLGLDNIGLFDRSMTLPDSAKLQQADGTAWMGLFCSSMLTIAIELAQTRPVYEDIASKFLEHFIAIVDALNGDNGLWDNEQNFYFDRIRSGDGHLKSLAVRSIVGLIPLYAVTLLPKARIEKLTGFHHRLKWFVDHRPNLSGYIRKVESSDPARNGDYFISLVPKERIGLILKRAFDEKEFLSDFGIRALSKSYEDQPYEVELAGNKYSIKYIAGEGDSGLFGGNSNWRGPIWVPVNALLLNALTRLDWAYGENLRIEVPAGSGNFVTLIQAAENAATRLVSIFLRDAEGRRPVHGDEQRYINDPHWRDLVLFSEYFCGDTGRGLGACHQTGWTSIVATAITHRIRTQGISVNG